MGSDSTAVVRRFVEEFQSEGRVETGWELLAADFRNRTPDPGARADRVGVIEAFTLFPESSSRLSGRDPRDVW